MQPPQELQKGVPAYMDQQVQLLRTLIPKALDGGDVTAIHHSRVATRRLKAAIELVETHQDCDELDDFAKLLRKLRRQLGEVRDLDVMIGHLKEFNRSTRLAEGRKWLKAELDQRRNRALGRTKGKLSAGKALSRLGAWWGVRDMISQIHPKVGPSLKHSLHAQVNDFSQSATGLSDYLAAPAGQKSPDVHAIRIAGKNLRYSIEMAIEEDHPLDESLLKRFKKMQDAMGLWHDYVVLAECAMSISNKAQLAHHDLPVQQQVILIVQKCLARAQENLHKFIMQWREFGPGIVSAIESLFSESKTDRDPADSGTPSVPAPSPEAPPPVG